MAPVDGRQQRAGELAAVAAGVVCAELGWPAADSAGMLSSTFPEALHRVVAGCLCRMPPPAVSRSVVRIVVEQMPLLDTPIEKLFEMAFQLVWPLPHTARDCAQTGTDRGVSRLCSLRHASGLMRPVDPD